MLCRIRQHIRYDIAHLTINIDHYIFSGLGSLAIFRKFTGSNFHLYPVQQYPDYETLMKWAEYAIATEIKWMKCCSASQWHHDFLLIKFRQKDLYSCQGLPVYCDVTRGLSKIIATNHAEDGLDHNYGKEPSFPPCSDIPINQPDRSGHLVVRQGLEYVQEVRMDATLSNEEVAKVL